MVGHHRGGRQVKILLAYLSGAASIIVIAVVTKPKPEPEFTPQELSRLRWPMGTFHNA